jgi:hypothetical protein
VKKLNNPIADNLSEYGDKYRSSRYIDASRPNLTLNYGILTVMQNLLLLNQVSKMLQPSETGDDNSNRRDSGASRGEHNRPKRATTTATDATAARVGAMDVSRSEAQRAETNAIARSGDLRG